MLIWLRSQDPPCPLSPIIIHCAVHLGKLLMLEWLNLHEYQPDFWQGDLYSYAAAGGHVHVLKWLHAGGMPAPEDVINFGYGNNFNSMGNAKTPILMFLGDLGAPLLPNMQEQLVQAEKHSAPCTACCGGADVLRQILAGHSSGF